MLYEYCLPHAKEVDSGGRSSEKGRERWYEREQIYSSGAETPPWHRAKQTGFCGMPRHRQMFLPLTICMQFPLLYGPLLSLLQLSQILSRNKAAALCIYFFFVVVFHIWAGSENLSLFNSCRGVEKTWRS